MKINRAKKIGAVVLAAGSSSRLGTSKQLITIAGKTLLRHTSEVAYNVTGANTVVVLGFDSPAHEMEISNLPIHIVVNDKWKSGMGSSIKAGVDYLIKITSDLDAVIIMVCDQPYLTADHLRKIIETYERTAAPVVASTYASTVGVPALFDKSLIHDVLALADEQGAKKIIQQYSDRLVEIEFPGGEIDIDTQEDLQRFLQV
jgi:molybdenum cofactor cytidylyltransferase